MVERFTVAEFEKTLKSFFKDDCPFKIAEVSGYRERLWEISTGERSKIQIWSSIPTGSNVSEGTGENSIRVVALMRVKGEWKPTRKEKSYVTRVTGWQARLKTLVRLTFEQKIKVVNQLLKDKPQDFVVIFPRNGSQPFAKKES